MHGVGGALHKLIWLSTDPEQTETRSHSLTGDASSRQNAGKRRRGCPRFCLRPLINLSGTEDFPAACQRGRPQLLIRIDRNRMIGVLEQRNILLSIAISKINTLHTQLTQDLFYLAFLRNQVTSHTYLSSDVFDGCADRLGADTSCKRFDHGLDHAAGDIHLRALCRMRFEACDHVVAAFLP